MKVKSSNQSILKEISPGCSSEGLMLKLNPEAIVRLTGCFNIAVSQGMGRLEESKRDGGMASGAVRTHTEFVN